MQDDLLDADAAAAASEAKMRKMRQRLSGLSETRVIARTTGVGNEGTDRMRERLYMLQLTAEEAGSRYTEAHPKMQQVRQQIAEAEGILRREQPTRTQTTTGTNRSFEDVQAALLGEEPRLASLQARAAVLRRQTADLRGQLKAFGEGELRIAQLQREVELCQANYRKYSTNVEGARIDQAMERERMSNLSVVQPASYEPRAIRPQKAVCLAMGLLLGIFGGVGAAVVADRPRSVAPYAGRHRKQTGHARLGDNSPNAPQASRRAGRKEDVDHDYPHFQATVRQAVVAVARKSGDARPAKASCGGWGGPARGPTPCGRSG